MTEPPATVDLRAAARALLAGEGPLALTRSAIDCLVEVARAASPVLAADVDLEPLAFGEGDDGFGRLNVQAGVAVIPLKGVLTPRPSFLSILFGGSSGGLLGFRSDLRQAIGHKDVSSIVIDVNSPGGSVSLITETAAELRAARGQGTPIVAVANTMCASAAYEIAAQADELAVSPSGFVGSIGVFLVHVDRSGLNEAIGVNPTYIAAGRYKTEGNADSPLSAEAHAALQAEVDDFYDLFVADVAEGRGVTEDEVRTGYGEGRVLTARRALDVNLVDRIATVEQIVNERAGRVGGGGIRAGQVHPDVQARLAELQALSPRP
jgi:signal peptide peptidase SppA